MGMAPGDFPRISPGGGARAPLTQAHRLPIHRPAVWVSNHLVLPDAVHRARKHRHRAGRPFFIVTCSTSLEPVLARHFRQ